MYDVMTAKLYWENGKRLYFVLFQYNDRCYTHGCKYSHELRGTVYSIWDVVQVRHL